MTIPADLSCTECDSRWGVYHSIICSQAKVEGKVGEAQLRKEGLILIADPINPSHYKSHPSGIECIQITEHYNFCLGNAIKYLWRADQKNGLEDLKKAKWYLEREIANREKLSEKS